MAILMSFHKQAETGRTVTYLVLPDPDDEPLTLVIDKHDVESPLVGDLNHRAVARALGKAVRGFRATGVWPSRGSHQA